MIKAIFRTSDGRQTRDLNSRLQDGENWCVWRDDPVQNIEITTDSGLQNPKRASLWISLHVNQLDSLDHVAQVVDSGAQSIVLRGSCCPADVEKAAVLLTVCEIERGMPAGSIQIVAAFADTAKAVQNLSNWSFVPERLTGLLFDPQTLAASLGLTTAFGLDGALNPLLETARHLGLFAGKALGLPVYDGTIHPALSKASEHYWSARQMGFAGAVTESADQVALIADVFR